MRSGLLAVSLLVIIVGASTAASAPREAPREVNITTDSAPGWLPTEAQVAEAETMAKRYLSAKDAGDYTAAYGIWGDGLKKDQSFDAFSQQAKAFNASAGPVVERRITKVTWTKDPADAPFPGVYVALDLTSRFANIRRHCGYVVFVQQAAGGPFKLMREEATYVDDASSKGSGKDGSPSDVDAVWARLSARCPNYVDPETGERPPLPESTTSNLGYKTVAAALAGLKATPGVKISMVRGWTIAEQGEQLALWSFAPPDDPAYPAVARRMAVATPVGTEIQTSGLCEASKAACDDFMRRFQALNERIAGSMTAEPKPQ